MKKFFIIFMTIACTNDNYGMMPERKRTIEESLSTYLPIIDEIQQDSQLIEKLHQTVQQNNHSAAELALLANTLHARQITTPCVDTILKICADRLCNDRSTLKAVLTSIDDPETWTPFNLDKQLLEKLRELMMQRTKRFPESIINPNTSHRIVPMAWNPTGSQIAIGFESKECYALTLKYSPDQPNILKKPMILKDKQNSIAIAWRPSSDNTQLAIGSTNGTIRLWQDGIGNEPWQLSHTLTADDNKKLMTMAMTMAWSNDGTTLAANYYNLYTKEGIVRLWNYNQQEHKWGLPTVIFDQSDCCIRQLAWHPKNPSHILLVASNKKIMIGDASTGELSTICSTGSVESMGEIKKILWNNDGTQLAAIFNRLASGKKCLIIVWPYNDATSTLGTPLTIHQQSEYMGSLAWSPDGTMLACSSTDDIIRIWKRGTTEQPWSLIRNITALHIKDIAWHPDGTKLLYLRQIDFDAGVLEIIDLNPSFALILAAYYSRENGPLPNTPAMKKIEEILNSIIK